MYAAFDGNIMVNIRGNKRSGRYAGELRPGFEEIFSDISNVQYDVIRDGDFCYSCWDCETLRHWWRLIGSNIGQFALLSSSLGLCCVVFVLLKE